MLFSGVFYGTNAGVLLVVSQQLLLIMIAAYLLSFFLSRKKLAVETSTFPVFCKSTELNVAVKASIEAVGHYIPPWWYSKHLGVLIAFGEDPKLRYEREIRKSADGSHFAVDWYPMKPMPELSSRGGETLTICVFIPGLGLSSTNKFCQQFVRYCSRENIVCAVVTHRGVGMPMNNHKFWHPAHTTDVSDVLHDIQNMFDSLSGLKVFLVGYSAGANIVLKTLLRNPSFCSLVSGAFCVCVTYDYKKSLENLESTYIGRVYSYLMAMLFKDTIVRNKHVLPQSEVEHLLVRCGSSAFLSQIDSFLPKLYGYETEEQYFKDLSSFQIGDLSLPTLIIQPRDDPLHGDFIDKNIDVNLYISNENIVFYSPPHGNHFGFYEGGIFEAFTNKSSYTYPARIALAFFQKVLEHEARRKGSIWSTKKKDIVEDEQISIFSCGSCCGRGIEDSNIM